MRLGFAFSVQSSHGQQHHVPLGRQFPRLQPRLDVNTYQTRTVIITELKIYLFASQTSGQQSAEQHRRRRLLQTAEAEKTVYANLSTDST